MRELSRGFDAYTAFGRDGIIVRGMGQGFEQTLKKIGRDQRESYPAKRDWHYVSDFFLGVREANKIKGIEARHVNGIVRLNRSYGK